MKRTIAIVLAVLMLALVFAGCGSSGTTPAASSSGGSSSAPAASSSGGSSSTPPATPTTGSTPPPSSNAEPAPVGSTGITDLRVGMFAEPSTLDPSVVALQANNCTVMTSIYATLFDYDSSTGEYYPYAATGYEWLNDMKLKVTMRDDIYSHTGKHITAKDACFCLNRGTEQPALANSYQYFVPDSFTPIDDYSFTVDMTTVNYGAWQTLGLGVCVIYSQEDFESVGADAWARAPIGCGPYVFDHWDAGSEIVLKKNEKFWGDEPVFNSITFKFIPDANARTLALQSHDIDFAENIGASLAPTLQGVDGIELFYSDIGETQVIWFNNLDNEALAKPEVRKALEYATNKEAILFTIYNGMGSVSDSIFTTASAQYRAPKAEDYRPYDPAKAKEMLAAAGYGDGLNITLTCYESTDYQNLLTMLKEQWAEVGVNCEIVTYDRGAFFQKLYGGEFDAYTIHNVGLDPSIRLINYRSTLSRADGNLTGFANLDYDKLVADSFVAKTTAERDELVMQAADILRSVCPFFSIVDTFQIEAGVAGLGKVDNGPTSYMLYYHFTN